jgi:hypothetical protein
MNTFAGILVLTPILLGLWLGVRGIGRIRSPIVRSVMVIVIACLFVYQPVRNAVGRISPGEFLGALSLTTAIVVLHRKFG